MIEIIAIPNWNDEKKQSALHFSSINECAQTLEVSAESVSKALKKGEQVEGYFIDEEL